jgi:hypothetical protein
MPSPDTPERRWWVAGAATLSALALFLLSFLVEDGSPWWSSALSNIAGAVLLLVPAELALGLFRSEVAASRRTAEVASDRADAALATAERTATSLEQVRDRLIRKQTDELDAELATYKKVETDASRDALLSALRLATESELITEAGVRVPVWWTDLHYRFVIDGPEAELIVRLENDDQTVVSEHIWTSDESAESFYGRLVMAVREAGEDLGTGLNLPTESIAQLVEMLLDVARLRSQEPMGHRSTLRRIIERRDGWYFTERLVIPAERLGYTIAVSRLTEIDWEDHLGRKTWDNNPVDAIQFAHRLYGIGPRHRPTA